ncbi:hypothetical protein Misp01_08110 [Microtetraspora sp. NBRC 13810]|uniref:HAD-IC family P-type ATPase n=1 Tax=Microtetraspora sp. NBRC 13810 TaxID=3030990 RepID=UPI0024A08E97|nr:HAD-IC family P-type ATPase [Microtetraspora sp. NBRC 13810]GLW05681.1 hypothetical protein Misp01_08110 [Microtetraspora sp. NBRC 13810]
MNLFGALHPDSLLAMLPEPVRGLVPHKRWTRQCPGGLRIELRNIGGPGSARVVKELEERLLRVGVARAEVNGALGFVYIGCDPESVDHDKLLSIVEELDETHESIDVPWARIPLEQHARAVVGLGGSLLGTGLALAGNVTRIRVLNAAVPAFLQLAEHSPRLRRDLDRLIGTPAVDAMFATARTVTQTLAVRPVGLLIDSAAAAGRFADARSGLHAWFSREEEFAEHKGAYRHIRTVQPPRPAPLRHGPIERYAGIAIPASLGAYGLTAVVGRDGDRGLSVLIPGTPKAAAVGRDAFASTVVRALASRRSIVLHADALRRMDRIDTVVLDAEMLRTGGWEIHGVLPLGPATPAPNGGAANGGAVKGRTLNGAAQGGNVPAGNAPDGRADGQDGGQDGGGQDMDELQARLYALLDFTDPGAEREKDGWAVAPYHGGADEPEEVARWRDEGTRPVLITRNGVPVAVAGLAPELHPLAEALVGAAADCTVMLAGGEPWLARRLGVEPLPGAGARFGAAVRALQKDGHGVAVVARRARRALRQADLGIGVLDQPGRVPWDADVIGDLDGAHLLLGCLAPARRASSQSVRVAAAGATIGSVLALFGDSGPASVARAALVGDCTSLAALVTGRWAGRDLGRTAPPVGADRTPWHAMSAADALARLHSSKRGLRESDAVHRRTADGAAEADRPASLVRTSVEELANPLTPVLAAGAGVSAMVGSVLDAVLIGGVMVTDALLGGVQRRNADQALHRLTEVTAARVRLRRPDGKQEVDADELVPGDVIELHAGDAVPADCRVIKASGLEVDESSLTGESQLVTKTAAPTAAQALAERTSMVYAGTTIAAGHGRGVVVAVGARTESGRTAASGADGPPPSGVELRLRALSRRILPAALGSGAVLMVIDLLRGTPLAKALAPAVNLAVAAVPEGLPFIATVAELAAAKRLSARNALVRNPSTIEALGRIDVLCFDKTGTLTQGRITLGLVSDGRKDRTLDDVTPELKGIVGAALRAGPRFGKGQALPHPTDRAVVEGAERLGVPDAEGLREWERVDELPFEPGRGYHAVLGLCESGHLLSVKGAPEVVLTRCESVIRDGEILPFDDEVRRELEMEVNRLALQGYRVLAVAERPASDRSDLDEERIGKLRFRGLLGLADPVRPTAAESVAGLIKAGVRVMMMTGDHPSTAEAIAAEVNALNGGRVMTGPELDALDDDALDRVLGEVAVFARVTPAHKARVVASLRRSGNVIAVTGDGANDVPAIRLADVGVALGAHASPAARVAADIVVTDNRIETLIDALLEGRAMWGSVRDALGILLGGNIGEIVFTVGSSVLTGRSALNARQLLLVNLLTDMLPAMAVAVRPPSAASPERLLAEGPEASLGAALTRDIYVRAVTTAVGAAAAWILARMSGTRGRADTVGLIALVSTQLLQTLAMGRKDRMVLLAALSSLGLLVVVVSVPGLSHFFGSRPVGPVGWSTALACAVAASLLGKVIRWPFTES